MVYKEGASAYADVLGHRYSSTWAGLVHGHDAPRHPSLRPTNATIMACPRDRSGYGSINLSQKLVAFG